MRLVRGGGEDWKDHLNPAALEMTFDEGKFWIFESSMGNSRNLSETKLVKGHLERSGMFSMGQTYEAHR